MDVYGSHDVTQGIDHYWQVAPNTLYNVNHFCPHREILILIRGTNLLYGHQQCLLCWNSPCRQMQIELIICLFPRKETQCNYSLCKLHHLGKGVHIFCSSFQIQFCKKTIVQRHIIYTNTTFMLITHVFKYIYIRLKNHVQFIDDVCYIKKSR